MGLLAGGRRRRDLLLGLAVVLPIVLVALVGYWTARAVVGAALTVVDIATGLGLEGSLAAAGLLLAITVLVPLVLVGIGVGVRHRFGHRVVAAVDRTLSDLPAVGPIYSGLRRSRDAIAGDGGPFSEVVSVELAAGVHAMAFVVDRPGGAATGEAEAVTEADRVADALEEPGDDDLVTVYLPFAPNPAVGGHLLGVDADRLRDTDLSVAEGIGILVGFGPHEGGGDTDPPLGTFYAQYGEGSERDGAERDDEGSVVDDPAAD